MEQIWDQQLIANSLENKPWDFGNKILYDLCRKKPLHKKQEIVIAKIWLIGRSYSAALERFAKEDGDLVGDEFYETTIWQTFRDSEIDDRLKKVEDNLNISKENLVDSLELHGYLTQKLNEITRHNKRSFSSKYLHFHLPDLFFIYDSRVVKSLRGQKTQIPKNILNLIERKKIDKEYASFCCKCLDFKEEVEAKYSKQISTRQLDNLLIKLSKEGIPKD